MNPSSTDQSLPPEVIEAIDAGHTIEAIKRLRRARSLGLKEAKEAVEAYLQGHPPRVGPRTSSPNGIAWLAVVIALIGLAIYFID
ncbi:MAG: hypothetical protein AAF542_19865 [Pseudomonadota bacterium]